MTRLFITEARRICSRRLVWVFSIAVLVIGLITAVVFFINAETPESNERQFDSAYEQCIQSYEGSGVDETEIEAECNAYRSFVTRETGEHLTDVYDESAAALGNDWNGMVVWNGLGALFLGSSLVGFEWRTGGIATLLTWEPRRPRVVGIKLAAILMVISALVFVLMVLVFAFMLPTYLAKGSTDGADLSWWMGMLGGLGRGALVAGAAATFAAAFSMVARNTVGGVAVLSIYLLAVESVLRSKLPELAHWFVLDNVSMFLGGDAVTPEALPWSIASAGMTLLGLLAAGTGIAIAATSHRDVAGSS